MQEKTFITDENLYQKQLSIILLNIKYMHKRNLIKFSKYFINHIKIDCQIRVEKVPT